MQFVYHSSGCCYFLSTAINPFIYSLLSKRFRRGFIEVAGGCISWGRRRFGNAPVPEEKSQGGAQKSLTCIRASPFPLNTQVIDRNASVLRQLHNAPGSTAKTDQFDSQANILRRLSMNMPGPIKPTIIHQIERRHTSIDFLKLKKLETKEQMCFADVQGPRAVSFADVQGPRAVRAVSFAYVQGPRAVIIFKQKSDGSLLRNDSCKYKVLFQKRS